MTYKFKCPACGHVVSAEAEGEDEALEKIMAAGAEHMQSVHPEMPVVADEEMKQQVKAGWWTE